MLRRIPALSAMTLLSVLVSPSVATSQAPQARVAFPQTAPVTSTAFIKLGDIKGESLDSRHKDWIEIQSYSFGASNSGRTAGPATATATPSSPGTLTITKTMDKSSPVLMQQCSAKQSAPEVVVHLPSPQGGPAMMEYVLKEVMISSCVQSNGRESLSFNYTKIEFKNAAAPAPAATR